MEDARQRLWAMAALVLTLTLVLLAAAWQEHGSSSSSSSSSSSGRERFLTPLSMPFVTFRTLADVASPHQKVKIMDSGPGALGKCMVIDNEVQLCEKDEHMYHEMMVHFPAQYLERASPRRVLIVGGGDCMTLREVLKYPGIERVVVLELDREVCLAAEEHFGVKCHIGGHPKVSYIFGDAAVTVGHLAGVQQRQRQQPFDMIIVDTTEDNDNNISVSRPEFFQKLAALLSPRGVLVKNGEDFNEVLEGIFSQKFVYGYDSVTFDTRYKFVIAARRGVLTRPDHKSWQSLGIRTRYYSPARHSSHISWYSAYKVDGQAEKGGLLL